MCRFFFVALLIHTVSILCAQNYNYTLRNYSAQDGLPQSQVNVILEDKNGYLWIGTEGGGLARYDGREFKVYTTLDGLLSNIVSFLKLDKKNNLWIVHPRGISKFDGVTFKKFIQPPNEKLKRVRRLFEVNDTIFTLSTPGQIGKIYNDSLYYWGREIEKDKRVLYTHGMPNKNVLICLSDSSFAVKSENGTYSFSHKNKFNVLKNIFNYKGKVIVRSDQGFFEIDFKNRDFNPIDIPLKNSFVFYDSVNDVFWSRNGNAFMREYKVKDSHRIDTVLKNKGISQVLIDSERNTWICTFTSGLFKYFIQDFDKCSSDNMQVIMSIKKDSQGASWIGSQTNGLWRAHKSKFSYFFDKRDSYKNSIHCIVESPSKQIYIGTAGGLGLFDKASESFKWYTRDEGLSSNNVVTIQFDERGDMWLATYGGGINHYDGKVFKAITTEQGLTSNSISAMHYSTWYKKIFYGNEYGLGSFQKGLVETIQINGAENTSVLSINPYKDSLLLIGTSGAGIVVFDPKSNRKRLLTVYDGLPSGFIYFVAADSSGYVWAGTEKGVTRLKIDENFEIQENLHYGFENGLKGVETNQNAFYLGNNEKYFGLLDGLYQYNELSSKKSGHTFDLHLTSVELLYGEFNARDFSKTTDGFFKTPVNPVFDPEKNHITFRFNRVNKQNPKSVRYKYFLDNYDKKWSLSSSNNYVTYSNLPPGEYTFRVAATDANGGWGGNILTYPFVIKAPFYQTATFIVISVLVLLGVIIAIAYLRVRQRVEKAMMLERIRVTEQENLRKEIARDFHDEMGNQLTRIINYVSLLKLNGNGNGTNHTDLYTKVENSAKYLYSGTRDFIWSIDPVNDELSRLFIHIRDFGEKLFEEKDIQFRATNEIKGKTKLPYGFSRQVNLIFKEAMTNTFKYSQAKNATLALQRNGEGFELYFEDDGIGFNAAERTELSGLKNIRERADKIQAVLRIRSREGSGTKILISFRFTKTQQYGITI
jgi:signal transduction histidine kinase